MNSRYRLLAVGFACVVGTLAGAATAAGQEADVRAAIERTFAALRSGDAEGYLGELSPEARIFVDAGGLVELDAVEWLRRLEPADWTPRDVRTRIIGRRAVSVVEVEGALRVDGLVDLVGPWRYAETRVLDQGRWRILQQEISPLGEATAATGRVPGSGGDAGPPTEEGQGGPGIPGRGVAGTVTTRGEPITGGAVAARQGELAPGVTIVGPPPPVPPAVIARDGQGNATVRAIRLSAPLDIDGRLDEPVYSEVPPLDEFIQAIPNEGSPASELTEAWIMFDDDNVYVSARMHESVPESDWVANEMRRDLIRTNDNFGLVFDTYYDRRNGYFFYVNPLGAFSDIQVTNEGNPNFDWNPVWEVRSGRFDGGWTVEMRFPFKSLRYRPGTSQVWGLQLRRMIRRKNETSQLTPIPASAAGPLGSMAILRLSRAATLVGLEAPPPGVNIDVKPYGIAGLTTDRTSTPTVDNDLEADGGVDVKWAITQNLAADFTYNTDFAQVEVDEQQVNLTRFNLFFPEKREFFLESRGIFDFAAGGRGGGGGGGFRGGGGTAPTLFFSRRIGLQGGSPVPIVGGGRLTGKLGPFDVGALNIQTDDVAEIGAEDTNFAVVRIRGDILQRSNVGALFTRRSRSLAGNAWSHAYAGDASFAFLENLYLSGFYALTETPGRAATADRLGQSYQARMSWDGDLEGFSASHLLVESDFNPEVGFLRRSGFRQTQLSLRGSPRPTVRAVRQVTLEGSADYIENAAAGHLESRDISVSLGVELENSDVISVGYTDTYEYLVQDERITGALIPAGRYPFQTVEASYSFGPQRSISGTLSGRHGTFYGGHLTSVGLGRGRIEVLRQLSFEPSVSYNWVRLPGERFNALLAVTRMTYTFSPRMFFSALVQYNSLNDSFSANARLRWEYAPGSELFLVYTEERDTFNFERFPVLQNRGLVIKMTRLLRL